MRKAMKRWAHPNAAAVEKGAPPPQGSDKSETSSMRSGKPPQPLEDRSSLQSQTNRPSPMSPVQRPTEAPAPAPVAPGPTEATAPNGLPHSKPRRRAPKLRPTQAEPQQQDKPLGRVLSIASSIHEPYTFQDNAHGRSNLFREGSCSEVPLSALGTEPRAVMVLSVCGMDEQYYRENLDLPGIFNLQLKAPSANDEELLSFPARLTLSDAMTHLNWMKEMYPTLQQKFPDLAWNQTMTVDVPIEVSQAVLHALVQSLYSKILTVDTSTFEQMMAAAHFLKSPCLLEAVLSYMKADIIPRRPAACFRMGVSTYPELGIQESVLEFFRNLQWDGAISRAMLYDFSMVMNECEEQVALDFLIALTRPPALISQLQVASMAAQLSPARREKVIEGLKFANLSMADMQSLLHWANNRQFNRAILASSPTLWSLFYSNISSNLLPLDHLKEQVGPKAGQMKLWDLPLSHLAFEPGQYKTRRSGWLHHESGTSFCMEAAIRRDEATGEEEWGVFCNPDRDHAFHPGYVVKMCAIQQGSAAPVIQQSPAIRPDCVKKEGLGLGFDGLISKWAADSQIVWEKEGEFYLTLGLYVDTVETVEGQQGAPDRVKDRAGEIMYEAPFKGGASQIPATNLSLLREDIGKGSLAYRTHDTEDSSLMPAPELVTLANGMATLDAGGPLGSVKSVSTASTAPTARDMASDSSSGVFDRAPDNGHRHSTDSSTMTGVDEGMRALDEQDSRDIMLRLA